MRRIFVDCDNTLVLWLDSQAKPIDEPTPFGRGAMSYTINQPLVDAVLAWLDADVENRRLIVWTGGGEDYAERWAHRAFPGRWHACAMKRAGLSQPDDILVDDMAITLVGTLYTPEAFISCVAAA